MKLAQWKVTISIDGTNLTDKAYEKILSEIDNQSIEDAIFRIVQAKIDNCRGIPDVHIDVE